MPRAIVLGSGMVGRVMAADMVAEEDYEVLLVDRSEDSLREARALAGDGLETLQADLSDPEEVSRIVGPCDVVLGALPSTLGYGALQGVIEAGRPICDISFMGENALELDSLARAQGVTAVVDCGVAPGLSNIIAGHVQAQLDETESLDILVGGLPRERTMPFQYKAGFSPSDVIEEYTRPARMVEDGKIVIREALSGQECIDFPETGVLEAFITDGLRSLVRTLDIPNMQERTLRYPGHADLMRAFRETGLFSLEPVEVDGRMVRPRDLTSRLLFPLWSYEDGEEDLTIMRITVQGRQGSDMVRWSWDLYHTYDTATGTTSMSRTTGFPCTIIARMLATGDIDSPGVLPPEVLGQREGFKETVLDALAARDIMLRESVEVLPRDG